MQNINRLPKEMREWLLDQYIPCSGVECTSRIYSTEGLLKGHFKNKYTASYIDQAIQQANEISHFWILKIPLKQTYDDKSDTKYIKPLLEKHPNSFLAIDFETANESKDSACAIGLVRVDNNIITHYESHLIRPPSSFFRFTNLHGISWEKVKYAPTFEELWPDIQKFFDSVEFLVAHYAPFDKSVLEVCCRKANITIPDLPFKCTVKLSRSLWGIRPTKLNIVCAHFNIPLDHHQVESDVLACAKIMLLASNNERKEFELDKVQIAPLKTNADTINKRRETKTNKISQDSTSLPTAMQMKIKNDFIETNYKSSRDHSQSSARQYNSGTKDDGYFIIVLKVIGIILALYFFIKIFSTPGCQVRPYNRTMQVFPQNNNEINFDYDITNPYT